MNTDGQHHAKCGVAYKGKGKNAGRKAQTESRRGIGTHGVKTSLISHER